MKTSASRKWVRIEAKKKKLVRGAVTNLSLPSVIDVCQIAGSLRTFLWTSEP